MGGRIVSVGSVIVDMTLRLPSMPQIGGDVIASSPSYDVGGGFNLMYASRQQGADVVYAGRYGTGTHGSLVRVALDEMGIPVVSDPDPAGDTGVCIVFVDANAERSFVTAPGVEAVLTKAHLDAIEVKLGDVVAISGYDLAYESSADALSRWVEDLPDAISVLLDPGPLVASISMAHWSRVVGSLAVVTVNAREANLLAAQASAEPAVLHREIRARNELKPDTLVVIRHGAGGCTFDGGPARAPISAVPSMKVVAVDTTGAGDTHTGVLLAEMTAGTPTYEALHRANIAAALSVTQFGPASAPSRDVVDAALRQLATSAVDYVPASRRPEVAPQ